MVDFDPPGVAIFGNFERKIELRRGS